MVGARLCFMQRRKKPMRSPFVVTISVAAAVAAASLASAACGGKVPGDGIGSSGTSGSSGSSGTSGTSGSSGTSGISVNPPAPSSCTNETKAGDPCFGSSTTECFVEANGTTLICVEGTWTNQEITNPPPPPPQCPDAAPTEGSPCFVSTGSACSYVDGCAARPANAPADKSFVCSGGTWNRSSTRYVAACPASVPNSGDSCATCAGSYPANCMYPTNGSGCPGPTAACDPNTLTWNVAISTCNPPALDAGAGGPPQP